ncbi:S1/P1 nuclease [Sphingomonas oligophenolica]|uniref:S1/P1 nuclease n=1 Tax=Sphingomonas oligophenolica TaxID=301154 RepID=A0ABU9Y212_9SPHN
MKTSFTCLVVATIVTVVPAPVFAWGSEGHILVAAIARSRLTPETVAKIDAILAQDHDTLTPPDMLSRSTWADAWRGAGHRETAEWHFVDVELGHPDFDAACYGHPAPATPPSTGPAQDCIVDKVAQFAQELGARDTPPAERILALKYVLHFVGDLHQPLHVADNHDRGGNCVHIALGGQRTVNLHSYWDTVVVSELGSDARDILGKLESGITSDQAAAWSAGDFGSWAKETNGVAVSVAYSFKTPPRCEIDMVPLDLPAGYDGRAQAAASLQLRRAGVRLAVVLEKALGPLAIEAVGPKAGQ